MPKGKINYVPSWPDSAREAFSIPRCWIVRDVSRQKVVSWMVKCWPAALNLGLSELQSSRLGTASEVDSLCTRISQGVAYLGARAGGLNVAPRRGA